MLGGPDLKTLYICTADGSGADAKTSRTARIEAVAVTVAGAGRP